MRRMYVLCPEKITGPAPQQPWIPADMPCGLKAPIRTRAEIMDCMCPRGHRFIAAYLDVIVDGEAEEGRS